MDTTEAINDFYALMRALDTAKAALAGITTSEEESAATDTINAAHGTLLWFRHYLEIGAPIIKAGSRLLYGDETNDDTTQPVKLTLDECVSIEVVESVRQLSLWSDDK